MADFIDQKTGRKILRQEASLEESVAYALDSLDRLHAKVDFILQEFATSGGPTQAQLDRLAALGISIDANTTEVADALDQGGTGNNNP